MLNFEPSAKLQSLMTLVLVSADRMQHTVILVYAVVSYTYFISVLGVECKSSEKYSKIEALASSIEVPWGLHALSVDQLSVLCDKCK